MKGDGHDRVTELAATIARLAAMDRLECELSLRQAASEFGIPAAEIRRAVSQQRTRDLERAAEEIHARRAARRSEELDPNKIVEEAAKPELIIETANLPTAVDAVRDLLKAAGGYYEWGIPAKVVTAGESGLPQIVPLTVDAIVNEVHRLRRPVKLTPGGQRTECTLPDRVARQYLAKKGEWQLPRLAGITTAPLLGEDGSIRAAEGFDRETRLFCANVPVLEVPDRPTKKQAEDALRTLRAAFRTFPFADSARLRDEQQKLDLVDIDRNPGLDESSFLVGLMTAVCRPCLNLAPGLMLVAPQRSGSGSGKGLLARAICLIAFGLRLAGFTPGKDKGELDKRINGDLLEGAHFNRRMRSKHINALQPRWQKRGFNNGGRQADRRALCLDRHAARRQRGCREPNDWRHPVPDDWPMCTEQPALTRDRDVRTYLWPETPRPAIVN
jgi:hypothetical protein